MAFSSAKPLNEEIRNHLAVPHPDTLPGRFGFRLVRRYPAFLGFVKGNGRQGYD
jgi:hypothetical protein